MTLRSAEDVLEEYNAVRSAWLQAVRRQSYSISTGSGSRSTESQNIKDLKNQMGELSVEYTRLTGQKGLRVIGVTPV